MAPLPDVLKDKKLDEFDHAGVKGMKWGVRKRDRGPSSVTVTNSSSGKSAKIKINPKKTTVDLSNGTITTSSRKELKSIQSQINRNKLKLMSDEELQKRIKRLEMEQKFKKLNAAEMSPGQKLVRKVLSDTGNQVMSNLTTQVIVPSLTKAIISGGAKAVAKSAVK